MAGKGLRRVVGLGGAAELGGRRGWSRPDPEREIGRVGFEEWRGARVSDWFGGGGAPSRSPRPAPVATAFARRFPRRRDHRVGRRRGRNRHATPDRLPGRGVTLVRIDWNQREDPRGTPPRFEPMRREVCPARLGGAFGGNPEPRPSRERPCGRFWSVGDFGGIWQCGRRSAQRQPLKFERTFVRLGCVPTHIADIS